MKQKTVKKFDSVLQNSNGLKRISQTFSILDELNNILQKFLPHNLKPFCHIGAIDTEKNYIILYVNDSSIQHIIYNMVTPMLENFNRHHFSFDGVITRITQYKKFDNSIKYKKIDNKFKSKLQDMADSINKPDLVKDNYIDSVQEEEKEIDL